MTIFNATPHALTILDMDGVTVLATLPTSGLVLRCATQEVAAESIYHYEAVPIEPYLHNEAEGLPETVWGVTATIPTSRTTYGAVQTQTGQPVPEPEEGVFYVVSALVRLAAPERTDFLSPGPLVRGADGQPIGCRGLTRN